MRLNRWLVIHGAAGARRKADDLIAAGRVRINGAIAALGDRIDDGDTVTLDGIYIEPQKPETHLVALNKPTGYICSHRRQGSAKTIFSLLPEEMGEYKIAGRLDKDSEGLVLLTNDGELANALTHPSHDVVREYQVELSTALTDEQATTLTETGILLDDELRQFASLKPIDKRRYAITLHEGRNRQIRRSFEALGVAVLQLQRIKHGQWELGDLELGHWRTERLT
ncbi:MAG: pseudouridine synthase [Candidatus Saccharibacteria bacterium]